MSALPAPDERLPLHARVHDDLATRIRAGHWDTATALPAEAVLAEEYGISPGTMRRVLADLVLDGLIERRHGHGTFVRRADFGQSLFRFFRMGNGTTAIPGSRILARTETTPPADIAHEFGGSASGTAVHLHRLRLWDDTAFLVEDIWLPLPLFRPFATIDTDRLGPLLYPEYERSVGVVIGSATETLTVRSARRDTAALLGAEDGEPLVRVARIARTHAGEVVEVRQSYGLASTFHYTVEVG